jgi:hypothetical protein
VERYPGSTNGQSHPQSGSWRPDEEVVAGRRHPPSVADAIGFGDPVRVDVNIPKANPRFLAAGAMENRFAAAADALAAYIEKGSPQTSGAAEFAILHLVSRSLADLRWGQYLGSSGYPIQMYSVIRPVSESLHLIDLFVQEPELAQSWADGNWREFMPARVRERLGVERDPLYEFLSEHSHPRFAGLQISAFQRVGEPDEQGRKAAILYMGEIPFDVPPVLLATAMPGVLLAQLALAAGHVRLASEAAQSWPSALRTIAFQLGEGWASVDAELPQDVLDEDGETTTPLRFIREIATRLQEMASELEALVDEGAPGTGLEPRA